MIGHDDRARHRRRSRQRPVERRALGRPARVRRRCAAN